MNGLNVWTHVQNIIDPWFLPSLTRKNLGNCFIGFLTQPLTLTLVLCILMHSLQQFGFRTGWSWFIDFIIISFFFLFFENFSDIEMEGHFTNFFSKKKVDTSIGYAGTDLFDPTRNCAILIPMWNGWKPWLCKVPQAHVISCACEHPGQIYLQLRGLCPESTIDKFYVPKNKKRSGAVFLLGLHTTTIEYDTEKLLWKLVERSQNVIAKTDAPLASYVLGSHEWIIENDNKECNKKVNSYNKVLEMSECQDDKYSCTGGQCNRKCSNIVESHKTVLKLTGCREGEFTCSDGQCIRYTSSSSSNSLIINVK